jgi:fatty acyl-CoA reductase
MYASNRAMLNCVAVDIVAKTLIVVAWKNALDYQRRTLTMETDATNENLNCRQLCVYNCASLHNMDLELLVYDGQYLIRISPFEKTIWLPGGGVTLCKVMNQFRVNEIFGMLRQGVETL